MATLRASAFAFQRSAESCQTFSTDKTLTVSQQIIGKPNPVSSTRFTSSMSGFETSCHRTTALAQTRQLAMNISTTAVLRCICQSLRFVGGGVGSAGVLSADIGWPA